MPAVASDAAITYLLGLTLESARVFDSAPVTEEPVTEFVLVGHDGDDDYSGPAATATLARAAFEEESRDEEGAVILGIVANRGDEDLSQARATTLAILTELETELRADSTLGGAVKSSWVSEVDTFQDRNEGGCFSRRVVTLSYEDLQDIL